jgi:hypothetical protein
MHFAASLVPCAKCGAPPGRLDFIAGPEAWVLFGECPGCGEVRSFQYAIEGDPRKNPYERLELGNDRPSAVIAPQLLIQELERLEPSLNDDPASVPIGEWTKHKSLAERAYTCAVELAKFLPAGGGNVNGVSRDRAWIERERERASARLDLVISDAPRMWAATGAASGLDDELRAVLCQAGIQRRPTVAELTAFLASRPLKARVWNDESGVHVEVDTAGANQKDVQFAVLGAAIFVDVDEVGGKVTMHFDKRAGARR